MKRISKQSRWLNIIIIVISAMILVFMLLGRFLGSGLDEPSSQALPLPNLRLIDFGSLKLVNESNRWQSDHFLNAKKNDKENSQAKNTVTLNSQYSKIAGEWQRLLEQPASNAVSQVNTKVTVTYFVQLYFEESERALVVKIEGIVDKNESEPHTKRTLITFVNSNLQILESEEFVEKILPASLLNKN
ncbi:MAG: hypothetical protein L3J46_00260 [Kangiellaceae bacterium]|nr:hypothetical protein [Kangiellaceae bacterium]